MGCKQGTKLGKKASDWDNIVGLLTIIRGALHWQLPDDRGRERSRRVEEGGCSSSRK